MQEESTVMRRRFQSRLVAMLMLVAIAPFAGANEKAEPDPAKSEHWEPIRKMLFGDREILDGRDVIRVYLALRAADAATVPVAVKAQIDQTPERYIQRIFLIVERNPSPTAGVFHFTPDSGRAQVETRLRFEDFSHVRAVAETSDGKLYMDSRWVKAAGGCSAPSGKFAVPAALMGKMKFRFDDAVKFHEPNLVQVNIRHPNESGLATDFDTSRVPQFVRSVAVTYDGRPVMSAEVDFSLSDNPTFRFWFVPRRAGDLRVEVEDTHDQRYVQTVPIKEGTVLTGG